MSRGGAFHGRAPRSQRSGRREGRAARRRAGPRLTRGRPGVGPRRTGSSSAASDRPRRCGAPERSCRTAPVRPEPPGDGRGQRPRGRGGGAGGPAGPTGVHQGCISREGTSEVAPEAVRQAAGGGCQSGWGRLLSVTKAIEAGTCRQGNSGWAWAGRPGGGGGYLPPLPMHSSGVHRRKRPFVSGEACSVTTSPVAPPQSGYHRVTEVAKNADTAKIAENCINCTSTRPTPPTQTLWSRDPKTLFSVKIKNPNDS